MAFFLKKEMLIVPYLKKIIMAKNEQLLHIKKVFNDQSSLLHLKPTVLHFDFAAYDDAK